MRSPETGVTEVEESKGDDEGAQPQHGAAGTLGHARQELGPGLLQRKISRRARAVVQARAATDTGTDPAARAGGDVRAAPASLKSSTILLSNNPEGIRAPGTLVEWSKVPAGNVGVYIHHSNLTATPLDLYVAVRPDGPHVRWAKQGFAAHGSVPDAKRYQADPNYAVAHAAAAGLDEDRLDAAEGAPLTLTQFHVVRLEARAGGDPPLMDARYEFHLIGGGAQVAVVSVAAAQPFQASAGLPARAAGNTKIAHRDTVGRAAGVYSGAEWNDAQDIDVKNLSEIHYWITSTNKAHPQAPQHEALPGGAKGALPLDPKKLAAWIHANAAADVVIARIARAVWQVDERWLEEKGWYDGARFTAKAQKDPGAGGMSVDYRAMTLGLRPAVAQERKALARQAQVPADYSGGAVAAYVQQYPSLGAPTDTANYGTEYHLRFRLHNGDSSGHKVHFALVNATDSPYRGSVRVETPAGNSQVPVIGRGGAFTLADVPVPAAGPGDAAEVQLHFISPGQITGGQYILIKK